MPNPHSCLTALPAMELFEPTIHVLGPAANHNMPCAICRERHAVIMLNTGVFEPCWECRKTGWRTVRLPEWTWRVLGALGLTAAVVAVKGEGNA